MEAKNIDDLIVKEMQNNAGVGKQDTMAAPSEPVSESKPDQEIPQENIQETPTDSAEQQENTAQESKPDQKTEVDPTIDEYGNPIPKQKTYTQDEVNRMMRERFNRTRMHEQNNTTSYQQPVQQQQEQASTEDEPWDVTLGKHIRSEFYKITQEEQKRQREAYEAAQQQAFETKFLSGMSKYQDFNDVVANKPITDDMLKATSSLNDPAAFIYAASKLHVGELERIAKINNPYAQAAEVGRLHERMVKEKKIKSDATKPLENIASDLPPGKVDNKMSIDERIAQHAKSKRR